MRKFLSRFQPHPATAIALLSLFISLSGIAYAASLPKNSVGSKQIKKNAVTNKKIKTGAVDSRTIKDGSVGAGDLSASAKTSGPTGPAGPAGSARAYGLVNDVGPTISNAKGLTAVTRIGTGSYCVTVDPATGIDVDSVTPLATVEYINTTITNAHIEVEVGSGNSTTCGAGMLHVLTNDNSLAASDAVSFTLMVP